MRYASPVVEALFRLATGDFSMGQTGTVLAVATSKGGAGKSACAAGLGVGLAEQGVLLVDMDPRGDLTSNLGIRGRDARNDGGRHLADVLTTGVDIRPVTCEWTEPWDPGSAVQLARTGLQLLAGGPHLDQVAVSLAAGEALPGLRRIVEQARARDIRYVIVDVPPGDPRMQGYVFDVATDVLVPVGTDLNALRGLSDIARVIAERKQINSSLNLTGVVLYGLNPAAKLQRREAREDAEAALNGAAPVLQTVIRGSVEYARALRAGLTAVEWRSYLQVHEGFSAAKPIRALAWDFEALLDELLALLAQRRIPS